MTIRLVLCHRHIRTVYFKCRTEIMAVYFSRWSFSLLILPFPLGPEIQSETDLSSSLWLFQLSVKEMGQESGNLERALLVFICRRLRTRWTNENYEVPVRQCSTKAGRSIHFLCVSIIRYSLSETGQGVIVTGETCVPRSLVLRLKPLRPDNESYEYTHMINFPLQHFMFSIHLQITGRS